MPLDNRTILCTQCQATAEDLCDLCEHCVCTCQCPPEAEDDTPGDGCHHGVGYDEECEACDAEADEEDEDEDPEGGDDDDEA